MMEIFSKILTIIACIGDRTGDMQRLSRQEEGADTEAQPPATCLGKELVKKAVGEENVLC